MEYEKGDRVRYPKKHEWVLGLVLEYSDGKQVKVHFVEVGEKTILLEYVQPIKVTGDDAIDPILDKIEESPSSSEMLYGIGRIPNHTAAHNQRTWAIIESKLASAGAASFEQLVRWCIGHEHSAGGRGFVNYCIDHGWLVLADRALDSSFQTPSLKRKSEATVDGAGFIGFREEQENEGLLYEYMHNFFGYGSLSSPLWFIGMEEGVGEESLEDRLNAWEKLGKSATIDIREFHRLINEPRWFAGKAIRKPQIQRTWKGPILAALAYFDMPDGTEEVRQYQMHRLATDDLALLELMPLPHKSLSSWNHGDIFPTKSVYHESIAPERISWFKKKIEEWSPKAVVMYGTTPPYRDYWSRIAGNPFESQGELGYIKTEKTLYVVCQHPVAHGVTDSYFLNIGKFLRNSHR